MLTVDRQANVEPEEYPSLPNEFVHVNMKVFAFGENIFSGIL